MATNNQLKKIHIAKKDMGLDDEDYRTFLARVTGKKSAKHMSNHEANMVLDEFTRLGWKVKKRTVKTLKYEDLNNRDGMATPKQLRMIEAMWMTGLKVREKTSQALHRFLLRQFKISDLRFIEDYQVGKIVRSIKSINQVKS